MKNTIITWKDFEKTGNVGTYLKLKSYEENKDLKFEFSNEIDIRGNFYGNIKDTRDSY